MSPKQKIARLLSRMLANLIAVVAVSAIFGVKTAIDVRARAAAPGAVAAERAATIASYDPYFTEHP